MSDLLTILDFILHKGWIGGLILLLILVVHDPDRVEKLRELILFPIFRLFKRGAKHYMAAKVGYATTEFFKRQVLPALPSTGPVKVRIKWVRSPEDPIMSHDGTLVLFLRESADQTRNILAAAHAAFPRVICPTLRANIQPTTRCAIDLAMLQKLADGLGKHARPVFQRYFLGPAAIDNPEIPALLTKLINLDASGTLVAVFLEELNLLGEMVYAKGDHEDKTAPILDFIEFLLTEARRGEGEQIRLGYLREDLKVAIMLLAITPDYSPTVDS